MCLFFNIFLLLTELPGGLSLALWGISALAVLLPSTAPHVLAGTVTGSVPLGFTGDTDRI